MTSSKRKIIVIGESMIDMLFPADTDTDTIPVTALPGGRLLNSAAMLATEGMPVHFVSEAGADPTGQIMADFLTRHGVNTDSLDRFTDGVTAINLFFDTPQGPRTVCHRRYPAHRFDVAWPRIDPSDIVVFGAYFALDPDVRPRLIELLTAAAERNALLVYLPGFLKESAPYITHVMPAILDNLERANVVVTRSGDLPDIFGRDSAPASAYDDHIKFYCPNMFNVGPDGVLTYFSGDAAHTSQAPGFDNSLRAHSAMLAGVVMALLDAGATPQLMESLMPPMAATICKSATAHYAGIITSQS